MKKYESLTDCPVIKVLFESSMPFQLTTTMKMGISLKPMVHRYIFATEDLWKLVLLALP